MAVDDPLSTAQMGFNRNPYNYAKLEQVTRDIATQWLTTDEITQQLNLFHDESQDAYLESIELATRMAIEDFLGMSIFPITYKVYYPNLGVFNTTLFLDLPEVSQANQGQAGVRINRMEIYTDSNVVPWVVPATEYSYDPTGNRIILNSIPNNINTFIENPIVVTYTANASPIAQYPVVKQAGLMLLTHIYNNRSNTTEATLHEIPFGVAALLRPYKSLVM